MTMRLSREVQLFAKMKLLFALFRTFDGLTYQSIMIGDRRKNDMDKATSCPYGSSQYNQATNRLPGPSLYAPIPSSPFHARRCQHRVDDPPDEGTKCSLPTVLYVPSDFDLCPCMKAKKAIPGTHGCQSQRATSRRVGRADQFPYGSETFRADHVIPSVRERDIRIGMLQQQQKIGSCIAARNTLRYPG